MQSASTPPGCWVDPSALSELPKAEREHPLFRRGYNLGYSHRSREESLAELQQRGPQSLLDSAATATETFNVTSGGLLDHLAPGVRAARDLVEITEEKITTETPCCGRRITLQVPSEDHTRPAMCCHCRIIYQVVLIQEEPDGYNDSEPPHVAVFVVEHLSAAVAQHRTGRWEPPKKSTRRSVRRRTKS